MGRLGAFAIGPVSAICSCSSGRRFHVEYQPVVGVRPTDVGFELPADMTFEMVKIDRDVLGMDPDERSRTISALTSMGHEMGAVVVVEGIETAAHHNVARASWAEFGQGFFYSRALGASQLKAFLQTANAPSSKLAGTATVLGALAEALRQHPVQVCWFMTTLHQPTGATTN